MLGPNAHGTRFASSRPSRWIPVPASRWLPFPTMPSAVELRVVDRGPDIPAGERDRVFVPFQRLGETDNTIRVGLGLALSRGLTEVMDGTLAPEETPGGGLTMIISLPAAPAAGQPATPAPGTARTRPGGRWHGTPGYPLWPGHRHLHGRGGRGQRAQGR